MLPANRACVLCFATLIGTACTVDGEVAIQLVLPDDELLSPASLPVSEVTLIRSTPGEPPTRLVKTVENRADGLDMGRLLPGQEVQLAVELYAPTQRLIGYGRTAGAVTIGVEGAADVAIPVRRPFLYAGALPETPPAEPPDGERLPLALQVVDPTGPALGHAPPILDVEGSAVVEVSADGLWLAAAGPHPLGGEIRFLLTTDHRTPAFANIQRLMLEAPPDDIAIAPSGRYIAVAHRRGPAGGEGGISVIDLTPAGQSEPTATFVQIGAARQVVIAVSGGVERALVLVDGGEPGEPSPPGNIGDCDNLGVALVVPVVLSDAPQAELPLIERIGIIADMALTPDQGSVFLADPCRGVVERVDVRAGSDITDVMTDMAGVTTLAVSDNRLWAAGTRPADEDGGARLFVARLEPGSEITVTTVPLAPVTAIPDDLSFPNEQLVREVRPANAHAWSLAVLPGGQVLALNLFTHAFSEGLPPSPLFPDPVPALAIDVYEHVLLDTRTGTLAARLRTSCAAENLSEQVLFFWICGGTSANQSVSEQPYIPRDIAVLFGAE